MDWKKRPTLLEYWPDGVDYIMGMDENGTSDLKSIKRILRKDRSAEIDASINDFTLTGVIFDKKRYDDFKSRMNDIKYTFWEDGMADYKGRMKRVCFHSREIRNREHPFNKIDYNSFQNSLTSMITETQTTILSCHIDKKKHFLRYSNPHHPYHVSVRFIMERYARGLNAFNKKGVIMLESRGRKEDKFVLDHIIEVIEHGTNQNEASHFKNIVGAYFNPKWWRNDDNKSSFIILELADLVSYPIHKVARNNFEEEFMDDTFGIVEEKLYKYPKYFGWGLKLWP